MEQAIGSHVTSSLTREPCRPCLETFLQDEHDLSDDDLKHDPARGAGNGTGWPINGDTGHPSTQVAVNKLVTRTTPMQVTRLSHPSFFAHLKATPGMRACHLFSLGRGDRDAIVTMGGAQTPYMPRRKSEDTSSTHPEQSVPHHTLRCGLVVRPA